MFYGKPRRHASQPDEHKPFVRSHAQALGQLGTPPRTPSDNRTDGHPPRQVLHGHVRAELKE